MIEVRLHNTPLALTQHETGQMSFAFFCPGCGEVWGRVRRGQGWYVVSRWCEEHQSPSTVGGSFFQHFDWWPAAEFTFNERTGSASWGLREFLRASPLLAAHEFKVHMAWADKVYPPQQESLCEPQS